MKTFRDKVAAAGVAGLLALTGSAIALAVNLDPVAALQSIDAALAKNPSDGDLLVKKGNILWSMYRSKSAIAAYGLAANDAKAAAGAQYGLGRIYFFKGWQSEGAFPGWHEEPEFRDTAIAAFRMSIAADPQFVDAQVALGDALLMSGQPAEALASFDKALQLSPNASMARIGRWKALKALNRTDDVKTEVSAAAGASTADQLGLAREGYKVLGQDAEALALGRDIVARFPTAEAAAPIAAADIAAARQAKQYPVVIEQANAFATRFPSNAQMPAVQDALIEAYAATPSTDPQTLLAAINARTRMRPDPAPYLVGANALVARAALVDDAIRLAEASMPAAETFVNENIGSYKMSGKVQGSLNRSRASATDLIGWANFLKKNADTATAKLEEAERLSRSLDGVNQFHLGELARSRGDFEKAREYYLNQLTLQTPPLIMAQGKKALAEVYGKLGNNSADFETYLKDELDRRHEARRTALVRSMVDQRLPDMKLTAVSGGTIDVAGLRGKVLMLNFFASW